MKRVYDSKKKSYGTLISQTEYESIVLFDDKQETSAVDNSTIRRVAGPVRPKFRKYLKLRRKIAAEFERVSLLADSARRAVHRSGGPDCLEGLKVANEVGSVVLSVYPGCVDIRCATNSSPGDCIYKRNISMKFRSISKLSSFIDTLSSISEDDIIDSAAARFIEE